MADKFEQIISREDADFINQELIKATSEEVLESNLNWHELQSNAKNFLQAYDKLEKMRTITNQKMINGIMQDSATSTKLPAALNINKQKSKAFYIRAEYVLAFSFDEKVAMFRGQVPKSAIYVHYDSNGQKLSSYNLPLTSLAMLIDEEGRLTNINPAKLRNEGAIKIEDSKKDFPNEDHLKESQAAYMGTKSRLMQYYNKTGIEWWHRKNGLLMWKTSKKWVIARVTSFGDMKEAYVAALMTKHADNIEKLCAATIGMPSFYDHQLIKVFFENYIQKVTNKAAIVEEDVVTDTEQYAVKSVGAGMPSMAQYIWTAEWIASQKEPFTKEKLSEAIQKQYPMDSERNKIIAEGTGNANQLLEKILKENRLQENQATALRKVYKIT